MEPSSNDSGGRQGALDFEQADLGASQGAAGVCAHCGVPIGDEYYTLGDAVYCPRCHDGARTFLASGPGPVGYLRAAGFGLGAAAGGAVLWSVVTEVTGYELGIIAIAVGWAVGVAVRAGSGGRGGASFQALAIVFTYLAIVATYVPMILETWQATPVEELLGESVTPADPADGEMEVPLAADPGAVTGAEAPFAEDEPAHLEVDAGLVVAAVLLALVLPFMMGFDNAIGLLIIGIALWEAWRQTRRVQVEIAGPFRVGGQPAT